MSDKKKSILYILFTYLFFWIAFSLIGVVMMLIVEDEVLFQDSASMQFLVAIAAWTPTFALFVFFKKLYPNSSIKVFYKNAFRERLNLKLLLCTTMIQFFIFFGAVGITAIVREVSFNNLLHITLPTFVASFIFTAIQGPTGEQSGWRGFLQPHMEKRFSVVKASVVVGIIWGFWHTPLWFTSGYTGLELIQFNCCLYDWNCLSYLRGLLCFTCL